MRALPAVLAVLGVVPSAFAKTIGRNASETLSAGTELYYIPRPHCYFKLLLADTLSAFTAAQSLFDYSMQVQDARWDDDYKYIWYQETAGELSTRFTAWYAAGLLARKQGADVENAKSALENM